MLDVRRLKVLKEVAERGSFSAAADALNFTQSAVSQQIAALEKETGTTLLQRGAGGVRLTDAGAALVRHTDVILAQLADAERELAAIAGLQGGRVRLASFPSAGATLVTEAVSLFRARHPDVELSLTEGEPHETIPRAEARATSTSLSCSTTRTARRASCSVGLDCVHLLDDPLCRGAARRPSACRGARRSVSATWPASRGWRLRRWGLRSDARSTPVPEAGFTPHVAFESDDHNVLVGLVATGVGVALLPELACAPHRRGVVRARVGLQPVRQDPRGGAGGRLPLARDRGDDRGPEERQPRRFTPLRRPPPDANLSAMATATDEQVRSGLEGVVAFATEIAEPDKEGSALRYRGVDIEDLVGNVPFEQVWGLLVDGAFLPGLPPAEPWPLTVRTGDPAWTCRRRSRCWRRNGASSS